MAVFHYSHVYLKFDLMPFYFQKTDLIIIIKSKENIKGNNYPDCITKYTKFHTISFPTKKEIFIIFFCWEEAARPCNQESLQKKEL